MSFDSWVLTFKRDNGAFGNRMQDIRRAALETVLGPMGAMLFRIAVDD